MRLRVGMLTIGQSPRRDITDDLSKVLSGHVEIVEAGALDGLSPEKIAEDLKPESGHTVYVSRIRDGRQVVLSKEKLIPLVQEKISELESLGVDVVVLMCSGEFPRFKSNTPIIYPERLLRAFLEGISVHGKIGVLVPLGEQVEYARLKWRLSDCETVVASVSPYTDPDDAFYNVGRELSRRRVALTIMDCVGYTFKHKRIVEDASGRPAVTARGVVARALNELAW